MLSYSAVMVLFGSNLKPAMNIKGAYLDVQSGLPAGGGDVDVLI